MPSNRTSNDIDLVQPTQYNVQLNRCAKNSPLKPWRCLILLLCMLTILTTIARQIYLPMLINTINSLYSVNSLCDDCWLLYIKRLNSKNWASISNLYGNQHISLALYSRSRQFDLDDLISQFLSMTVERIPAG